MLVVTPEAIGVAAARAAAVATLEAALTRDNYRALLAPHLKPGDVLLNLSVA